ncbi:hypothetical protein [Sorangium sp. So ce1335]|uniref:hypothetical protein n=1 Tax=Sorangium sp. So ce1335 TaxID=3133335 RepID=UPI003F607031
MLAPPDGHPPSPSPLSRVPAAFVGALGGLCAVAALLSGRDVDVPPLALDAGLVLALLCVAAATGSRALRAAVPLGVLALAYLVVAGTRSVIGLSFVDDFGAPPRGEWLFLVFFGAVILSGIAGPLGALVFAGLVRPVARAWPRVLPMLSGILLALTTLLVAVSVARAVRMPAPDRYIVSLPSLGVIPPVTGEPSMIEEGPMDPRDPSGNRMVTRIHDMKLGEVGIRRLCPSVVLRCFLEVKPPGRPFDAQYVKWLTESYHFIYEDRSSGELEDRMWVEPGASIVVRGASLVNHTAVRLSPDSERHEVIVLDGEIFHTPSDREPGVAVLQAPWFHTRGMDMRSVAEAISAPRRWIAFAACGALLTAALLVHRDRVLRALVRIEKAKPAVLEESGWLTFADGSPPVRAGDRGLPSGPVLVLDPGTASAGAYRDAASLGGEILAGEQDEHLERGRERIARLDVITFAVAVLAPLPLLTAALTLKLW